jgi:hypothetical protein
MRFDTMVYREASESSHFEKCSVSLNGGPPVTLPMMPGKRPANRAFRISLTRENVCPLTGKLRGTNEDGYTHFERRNITDSDIR